MSGFGTGGGGPFGSGSGGGFGSPNFPAPSAGSSAGPPSFGFGNAAQAQPESSSGPPFGSTFSPPNPFGQSTAPSQGQFGATSESSGQGTLFGSSPNVVTAQSDHGHNTFGSSGNSTPGFNSFGGQNFTASNAPPVGNSAMGTDTSFRTAQNSNSNPNQPPQSTVTFGSSSNVVMNSSQGGFAPAPSQRDTGKGMPASNNPSNPFGTAPMASGNQPDPFMQQQMDDVGGVERSETQMSSNRPAETAPEDPHRQQTLGGGSKTEEARLREKMKEKKRLEAKIQETKRKLLERKQKINQGSKDTSQTSRPSQFPQSSDSTAPGQSLAERNAIRFGQDSQNKSSSILPSTLKAKVEIQGSTSAATAKEEEREHLENAVALIGTCLHMCPDDELIRREKESDIQQLEIPLPGSLHPSAWTLRNTAVKRFRRSAADYKLDVPDWVRPPDVLEKTCGYLEEWVMDRDRQGPDPRFPQGQSPPPLDVYQFIWDRTRMIRKDFTLQNYVGTGGECDARAVRCHERIARWHAMCEHQLSHISEFTSMQSQQNIQELGQTMKTLNQFYDDSLHRFVVEAPDDKGNETRSSLEGFDHGCAMNSVQGPPPVDFDGTPLNNKVGESVVSRRLIGSHAVRHPTHGTAEPEMRGLYILLTMNNEGGMEVLKYAAKMFQERPAVYHSQPVQLALAIFKAKKEYNYARFFAILRDPSTPYLFCCIMFKHVELMRKIAFRIMSKTFGARKKDTGEAIYDAYPLARLTDLLCFEDITEARETCSHYNITVKTVKVSSSQSDTAEIIYWRQTDFKEPVHPEKGYVLPRQPRKMTRTIEKKLNGATRLAVCRGEVSGDGAALQQPYARKVGPMVPAQGVAESDVAADERRKAAALLTRQRLEIARLEKEAQQEKERRAMEQHRLEEKRVEEERRRREEDARRATEEERARVAKQLELRKQRDEKKRIQEEHQRKREEKKKREEERRAAEEARQARLAQEARQLELQKKKEEADRRAREEEERLQQERRKKQEEEERRQREMLRKRQELAQRLLEEQRRREVEEKQKAERRLATINLARKRVVWRRWRRHLDRRMEQAHVSTASLLRLDSTFTKDELHLQNLVKQASLGVGGTQLQLCDKPSTLRRAIERCIRNRRGKVPLAKMAREEMEESRPRRISSLGAGDHQLKTTMLMKVSVIILDTGGVNDKSMAVLVRDWLNARLDFGKPMASRGNSPISLDVRSVVDYCLDPADYSDSDVALIVLPSWLYSPEGQGEVESWSSALGEDIPRVFLVLGEGGSADCFAAVNEYVVEELGGASGILPITHNRSLTPEALENALDAACRNVVNTFVESGYTKIERMPSEQLAATAILSSIWTNSPLDPIDDEDFILSRARVALECAREEAEKQLRLNEAMWAKWPPEEFCDEKAVKDYFGEGSDLPQKWWQGMKLESAFSAELACLSVSFVDCIERFLAGASLAFRTECRELAERRQLRRCLEQALTWYCNFHTRGSGRFLYFPSGLLELIVAPNSNRLNGTIMRSVADDQLPPSSGDNHTPIRDNSLFDLQGVVPRSPVSLPFQIKADYDGVKPPSNKRMRDESSAGGTLPKGNTTQGKRHRESRLSSEQEQSIAESSAYSKRLEQLANGRTVDYFVGGELLSKLLSGSPPVGRQNL